MLNLNECKKILNKKKDKYTDDEIILIRDYLMKLGQINVAVITNLKEDKNEASNYHVPSEFRRPGERL
jgi:hypothetical protein